MPAEIIVLFSQYDKLITILSGQVWSSKGKQEAVLIPTAEDLWFVPLGGTGEIGMNLNLYGHDGKWLMVDCGISFDEPLVPGYREAQSGATRHEVVAPDPSFIVHQRDNLCGLVITHAHEDHIGAVPYLWQRFQCPVYATPFTAEVLRRKLAQRGLAQRVPIIEVGTSATAQVGPFTLRWMAITHSVPEPSALLIQTKVGNVFHTADWKIDAQPVTGKPFNPEVFQALATESVLAMVGDSTNATKAGFSVSERNCFDGLFATIKPLRGRVVVSCFGSNIARLITLARVAKKSGRYMALLGRSLVNMHSIARHTGIWPDDVELIDPRHIGYLPPEEVLAVATGSQGEPRAALNRLALDGHPDLSLGKGDTVIFSAIVIPGNEAAVARLVARFQGRGIATIQSEDSPLPIHASGHPYAEELKLMYRWVKPQIAIPVHGEPEHLRAHADIALASGVRKHYVGLNGDLYRLAPQAGIRRGVIRVGRIPVAQN